ncbi:MAG: ABC transporter substrate-binding protein [Dictyoglomus thermophilum]|uniref:ABC transporter substrate-binding protein n=1 Tax=Dictyoglomus thermophilum TaxID=14 RepID=A0A7C2CS76_DICTH|nr:ABC transporter substrate-binding protein [Dictyoglomus thermophilum]MCX7719938.1 ABC transporter substrate-binding protein [Dictyoglomus thermophilum]TYT22614.1 ABC transporter substrate-binding protein [Dictyoglomus thermophilum]
MFNKRRLNLITIILITLLLLSFSFSKTFPIILKDDLGRTIAIKKYPERIISLAPSSTEILFAIGAGDKIVGVTDYCNYPKEALAKEKVGGFSNPNVEKIISLNPDLIVLYKSFPKEIFNQLEKNLPNTNFIVLDPKTYEDVMKDINLLGKALGKEDEARKVYNNMLKTWLEIQKKTISIRKSPKVLFLVWNDPFISVSPSTFLGDLLRKIKAINIVENKEPEYPVLSVEFIVAKNPDIIIIGEMSGISINSILNHPLLKETNAVKNKRVYTINDDLVFRPGPRLADGLKELFKLIYPEIN